MRTVVPLAALGLSALAMTACAPVETPEVAYDPADLRFSGETALEIETEFVTRFPDRDSGEPNNLLAVEWLAERLSQAGLECRVDGWEFVNFSRVVPLHNAVCVLPGVSEAEIVLTAHHDQAPMTIQGADNDGSGVSILVHMAEIFAAEGTPAHTLVFLFADAEEYGNAGTRRFLDTHPDLSRIRAALSLDNVGKQWYVGLDMDPRGWLGNYGPIWLQRAAQEAARAAGGLWVPVMRPALFQALEQAVPIAFMDEGPFVRHGIPAFGFAGICAPEFGELCYETYHTPADTIDTQAAETLGQTGLITEAVVRQLMAMPDFPQESGPYLFFEGSSTVLRGLPLTLLFLAPVVGFLLAAARVDRRPPAGEARRWRAALLHFLGLFLPLVLAIFSLYGMVESGLLQEFDAYFATSKHPAWTDPRWPAITIFLLGAVVMIIGGRAVARRFFTESRRPTLSETRSLAFLAIGLSAVFVFFTNPFSLLFMLPLFFWLLIRGRRGAAFVADLVFFVLGGLLVFALIYFFGFVILRIGLYVLWYLLMMFAIPMIHPAAAVAIAAILAAGLSLVIRPPNQTSPPQAA